MKRLVNFKRVMEEEEEEMVDEDVMDEGGEEKVKLKVVARERRGRGREGGIGGSRT